MKALISRIKTFVLERLDTLRHGDFYPTSSVPA